MPNYAQENKEPTVSSLLDHDAAVMEVWLENVKMGKQNPGPSPFNLPFDKVQSLVQQFNKKKQLEEAANPENGFNMMQNGNFPIDNNFIPNAPFNNFAMQNGNFPAFNNFIPDAPFNNFAMQNGNFPMGNNLIPEAPNEMNITPNLDQDKEPTVSSLMPLQVAMMEQWLESEKMNNMIGMPSKSPSPFNLPYHKIENLVMQYRMQEEFEEAIKPKGGNDTIQNDLLPMDNNLIPNAPFNDLAMQNGNFPMGNNLISEASNEMNVTSNLDQDKEPTVSSLLDHDAAMMEVWLENVKMGKQNPGPSPFNLPFDKVQSLVQQFNKKKQLEEAANPENGFDMMQNGNFPMDNNFIPQAGMGMMGNMMDNNFIPNAPFNNLAMQNGLMPMGNDDERGRNLSEPQQGDMFDAPGDINDALFLPGRLAKKSIFSRAKSTMKRPFSAIKRRFKGQKENPANLDTIMLPSTNYASGSGQNSLSILNSVGEYED